MPSQKIGSRVLVAAALIGVVATCVKGPSAFAADVDPLHLLPGSCNAVAVVKMQKLVHSPVGVREHWLDKVRRAYAEGLLSNPPWVTEVVQATTFGSATVGVPLTYSVYVTSPLFTVGDIAKHELAPVEQVAGHGAVLSSRNVYFVQLRSGLIGAVQPANRQAVAQWVRSLGGSRSTAIAADLINAVKGPENEQVAIAVDLKDMLNPRHIRNWILGTPKLKETKDVDGLVALICSLRLARLSVRATAAIAVRLELDFDSTLGDHAVAMQQAVGQWLDDAGARTGAMTSAKTTVGDKSLIFEGPLDERGLRHLLTLVQSPHLEPKEVSGEDNRQPNGVASAAYYNKVCDLLNALVSKNENARNYQRTALWHQEFARRIGAVSTTAVDPALVRWSRDVSKELVALAQSLRGESVRLEDLERSIRFDDTTTYQWYGFSPDPLYLPTWVYSDNNLELVRAKQDATVEKSAGQRDAIWNMLRQETANVAREMERTYNIKLKLPQ